MTILLEEPEFLVSSLADIPGRWTVICTDTKWESRLVDDLQKNAEIGVFWPRVEYRKKDVNGHGKSFWRTLTRSLFPNYISVCFQNEAQLAYIHDHDYVVGPPLRIVQQEKFIREITAIDLAIKINPMVRTVEIPKGTHCRVSSGPMMGTEGIWTKAMRGPNFVLSVGMPDPTGVELEIDPELLEEI